MTIPNDDPELEDGRYGDLPYDDVFDEDGELVEPLSVEDVVGSADVLVEETFGETSRRR